MKKLDINYMVGLGIKKELINRLDGNEKQYLGAFTMDHATSFQLAKMATQLILMELRDKPGALQLASLGLATSMQLKNLSATQINAALDNFKLHNDLTVASDFVRRMLITDQQNKLYEKTGGVKGDYTAEKFDEDEKSV